MNIIPTTEEIEANIRAHDLNIISEMPLPSGEYSIGIAEAQRIIRMKVEQAGYTHCSVYTRYYPVNKKWMGFSYETIPGTMNHPAVTVEVWDIDSLFPGGVHVGGLK